VNNCEKRGESGVKMEKRGINSAKRGRRVQKVE